MSELNLGDKIRIISASMGAGGVDGKIGIVTDATMTNGTGSSGDNIKVNVDGRIWGIGREEQITYEVIKRSNTMATATEYATIKNMTEDQKALFAAGLIDASGNATDDGSRLLKSVLIEKFATELLEANKIINSPVAKDAK